MRLLTYILVGGGAAIAVIALAVVLLNDGEPKTVAPQADDGQGAVTAAPAADTSSTDANANANGDDETTSTPETSGGVDATASAEQAITIDLAQVTPGGEAVFAGRAAPNAKVTVFEGDVVLGTATANADGEWVVVPERALGPGEHLVSVGAEDESGIAAVANLTMAIKVAESEDEQPLIVLLPRNDTDVPTLLQSPDDNAGTEVVAAVVPAKDDVDEAKTTEVAPPPGFDKSEEAAGPVVPALAPRSLSWKTNGELVVDGVSRGGTQVTATADGTAFGEAMVAGDGAWQLAGRLDIKTPRRIMRFALLDSDGQAVATYELPVASRDLSQGMDGSKLVIVQEGDALWRIAYRSYGEGVKYVDIVRRNAAAIDDPDLIFPNQIFAIPE